MTSLFLLCRADCHAFREAGGVSLLLDLIRRSDPDRGTADAQLHPHHSNLFNTLLAFKHDEEGLLELVQGGVIEILIAKVTSYTKKCSNASANEPHGKDPSDDEDDDRRSSMMRSVRQYRTTSPSYQAVELEYDQLFRLRQSAYPADKENAALNIFAWRPGAQSPAPVTGASSPASSTMSGSPVSSWSDYGSELDGSDSASSPVHSPATDSGSPTSLMDEMEDTICYSPVNLQPEDFAPAAGVKASSSSASSGGRRRTCCDPDLKMAWMHLGTVEGKDFYENWPESRSASAGGRSNVPVEWAMYLLHRISWLPDTPPQLTERLVVQAVIEYLTETPRPVFHGCRILFRLSRSVFLPEYISIIIVISI